MVKVGKAFRLVPEGCVNFLRERMLAPLRHQPYLVRWGQELLGHKSIETTMIYTHVVRELKTKARSPLDAI